MLYHALNRSNARMRLFQNQASYSAFEKVLAQARERIRMRIVSYCVMPNHWHFLLWPRADGDLAKFVGWLTLTHTQRSHALRDTAGTGHLYQGRFKSFLIQSDKHFLTVCRYVERNPLSAGLVRQAQDWRWGSLWRRTFGAPEQRALLTDGPLPWPRDWLSMVNQPQSQREEDALRRCLVRGSPFGGETWVSKTVKRLGLDVTVRPRGRPRKSG